MAATVLIHNLNHGDLQHPPTHLMYMSCMCLASVIMAATPLTPPPASASREGSRHLLAVPGADPPAAAETSAASGAVAGAPLRPTEVSLGSARAVRRGLAGARASES